MAFRVIYECVENERQVVRPVDADRSEVHGILVADCGIVKLLYPVRLVRHGHVPSQAPLQTNP